MNKIQFIALDNAAAQAIEMANLGASSTMVQTKGNDLKSLASSPGVETLLVAGDAATLERLDPKTLPPASSLLFYETETSKKSAERLMESGMVLIPVQAESLAALALSRALKEYESLLVESSSEDFSLGEESVREVFKPGAFNRLFYAEGRHLREAVLRMAHIVRSRRVSEGIAYVLHLPPDTPLFALDEALDVLEMATMPKTPVYFAIRFDEKGATRIRIAAFAVTPSGIADELQNRIDSQPTYLGKVAVIVEHFAMGKIDEKEMEKLCRDNGLDPDDADRLYDIFYVRSDETADLMRRLRESRSESERVDAVAKALSDNFIDVKILEELAILYRLSPDAIMARVQPGSR